MAESYGRFHEININVGCPSPKVSRGCFGARLMLNPSLVRDICYEMRRQVTSTPITVKCRLGVDDFDSYVLPSSLELLDVHNSCKAMKRHVAQRWADRNGEALDLRDLIETAMEACVPAAVLDATCDDDVVD
ncbi:hypothetical protein DYB32_001589 [Aphanomyces invadans]|uniref:DUS-like FMN-binding domain-containing protein n=1 Tax=Aphanomyces invadans TaxID=157072 RepID=A0A418B5V3_9STRA|nr:hypothetical protein DYB32_001589 [Aphanomyces invadans]